MGRKSDSLAIQSGFRQDAPMSDTPMARLKALGLSLPPAPKPVAAYVPFVRHEGLVFVSGQLPMRDGVMLAKGSVPSQVTVEVAADAARQAALNALAVLADAAGGLDNVRRIIRVGVFVCSDAGFAEQPRVANGASELFQQVLGEAGRHARAAVGNVALPLGACVEVEVLAAVA
jgi:enamine deaminase RidA (YjgF/YER057c/UK114 family)